MITLRLLHAGDIPFADDLRKIVGWNQTSRDWANYLEFAPNGCFLAEVEGRPAGTVTTIQYGKEEGWIGMVLVHPQYRRRGLGTILLQRAIDHLQTAGVRCIKLDATPAGKPLYQRLGFQEEYELARYEGVAVSGPNGSLPTAISLTLDQLPAVAGFDADTFGIGRVQVLRTLHYTQPAWSLVVRDESEIRGYLMAREGADAVQIGPCAALGLEEGRALLHHIFSQIAGRRVFIDIPSPNRAGREFIVSVGFTVQRLFTRMYMGDNLHAGLPSTIFSIGGPEKG